MNKHIRTHSQTNTHSSINMTWDESGMIFCRFEIIFQPFPFIIIHRNHREFIGISMEFVNSCDVSICRVIFIIFFFQSLKWEKEKMFWKHKCTYYIRNIRTTLSEMHWIPQLSLIISDSMGFFFFLVFSLNIETSI